jgi:peptidoglycan hydrolase FlgJ
MPVAAVTSANNAAAAQLAAAGHGSALRALPKADQVKAAAGQFEAIIVRQLLQDSVGKIAGEGAAGSTYGFMLTDVLANKISEGKGLGLGKMLEQQLSPRSSLKALDTTEETP